MRQSLAISAGINTDDTSFAVGSGAWVEVDKVRPWRGEMQVIGGWETFANDPVEGVCRNIFPWTDNSSILNVACGTHSHLNLIYDNTVYDITPAGLAVGAVNGTGGAGYSAGAYSVGEYSEPSTSEYFPRTWSFGAWGESLMANPRDGTIYWWQNDTGVVAAPLTNAPAEVTYMLVTSTRQVMAFGCNEEVSGDFNNLCIRFSDIEDPTDWTTSSANNAGEVILEGGGRIVAARKIGDAVFVWTDAALYQGTYTGQTTQPWIFTNVGDNCGLFGPNAAVVVSQTAYWMSPDMQFRFCPLSGVPDIVVSPVQQTVAKNMALSQKDKIVAAHISQFNEVWFIYPDSRDGYENSRYVSASLVDGKWSQGSLVRTAFDDGSPFQYPLGVDTDGNVYIHERGNNANGAAMNWYALSGDQYLGEAEQFLMLKGVWPDFKDQQGPVSIELLMRNYPQATQRSKGPYFMSPGQSKRNFLASGRVIAVKISGNSTPTACRFGKLDFELEATGTQ